MAVGDIGEQRALSACEQAPDRLFTWCVLSIFAAFTMLYEFLGHALLTGYSGPWAFDDLRVLTESSVIVWNGHGFWHLYAGTDGLLVAFPGFEYLLGILTDISHLLGLGVPAAGTYVSKTYNGYYLAGGTWYLVLPIIAFLGMAPLLAIERLSRMVGSTLPARRLCVVLTAVALTWMSLWWGHPDDALAVGLLLWAAGDAFGGRWNRSAWLLGLGLCVQPLVGLAIPILLAITPVRRWMGTICRIVVPVAIVLIPQFVGDPGEAIRQVLVQPAMTAYKTPWFTWAPHVSAGKFAVPGSYMVSGGLIRTVGVIAAVGLGGWLFWSNRSGRELGKDKIVWMMGLALSFRLAVEPVLLPYYIVPVLVVLAISASSSIRRLVATGVFGTAASVVISLHLAPWPYWCLLMAALGAVTPPK